MKVFSRLASKQIALALTGVVVSLILAELGLRFYLHKTTPIDPKDCRQEDPIIHHGYKPNTTCRYRTKEWDTQIKINSAGLRNEEIGSKDKFRVLVLGDSFTAAESVNLEETAVYLTEGKLNSEGKNVEVINAGVPSYSPILEYLWTREYGLELDPDLVILNFDLGDISGDNFLSEYYLGSEKTFDEEPSLKDREKPTEEGREATISWGDTNWQLETTRAENPGSLSFITKIKFWLHTHLKSYNFFAEATKKTIRKIVGISEEPIYVLGDVKNDFEYITRSRENANNRDVYKIPFENLKLIKSILDKKDIPFAVIYFPHGHQVSVKEWAKGRQFYGIEKEKIYPLDSINVLMDLSKEEYIEAYDASSAFISAGESQFPLFYPFDGHFTVNGNMVMANVLTEIIRKKI